MQSTDAQKIEKLLEKNKSTEKKIKEFEKLIVGSKEEYEVLATTREAMSFDEEE